MKQIAQIFTKFSLFFPWNKSRLDCFSKMLVALLKVNTVNLAKIAVVLGGKAKLESNYRRLRRFFVLFKLNYDQIAKCIVSLCSHITPTCVLVVDRTNWKFGKRNINILVLTFVINGVAIPVYWKVFAKRGNSSTGERIALLKRFIATFGKQRIQGILGDREFIGGEWFSWLISQNIPFFLRIKKNSLVKCKGKKSMKASSLMAIFQRQGRSVTALPCTIYGVDVYLTGVILRTGELLLVVSNVQSDQALSCYKQRWKIETLFQFLKSRGFNLEDTHITDPERLEKLFALVAVAACWALVAGFWKNTFEQPLKVKKHGRLEKSFFRSGLVFIQQAFNDPSLSIKDLNILLALLTPYENIDLRVII